MRRFFFTFTGSLLRRHRSDDPLIWRNGFAHATPSAAMTAT